MRLLFSCLFLLLVFASVIHTQKAWRFLQFYGHFDVSGDSYGHWKNRLTAKLSEAICRYNLTIPYKESLIPSDSYSIFKPYYSDSNSILRNRERYENEMNKVIEEAMAKQYKNWTNYNEHPQVTRVILNYKKTRSNIETYGAFQRFGGVSKENLYLFTSKLVGFLQTNKRYINEITSGISTLLFWKFPKKDQFSYSHWSYAQEPKLMYTRLSFSLEADKNTYTILFAQFEDEVVFNDYPNPIYPEWKARMVEGIGNYYASVAEEKWRREFAGNN